MPIVLIWNALDRILWGIVLSIQFICAIRYLSMAKEKEHIDEKLISFSYSIVTFSLMLSIIFILIGDSLIPGTFINCNFYGNYDKADSTFRMIAKVSFFFYFMGIGFFAYTFERVFKRTKYILTVFYVIGLILILILPFETVTLFIILFGFYLSISYYSILILYTKWSRHEFKAISSLILLGSNLIGVGFTLILSKTAQNIGPIFLILSPILIGLGTLICLTPTIVNPKVFSEALTYWIIFGAIVIGIGCIFEIYLLLYEHPLIILLSWSVTFLIAVFSVFYTLISVKTRIVAEKNKEIKPTLEAFTKPKKVTEEEVSISKEKKICLVCKNKISRENYICPDCGAFYCFKCSRVLLDLENACWVCETPFDESKSVKPYKREKEKIAVEEKIEINGKEKTDVKILKK